MSVFETKGIQRPRVLVSELSYQIQVNGILLETTRPVGLRQNGLLTPSELKELTEAYLMGVTPQAFAEQLQQRDQCGPPVDLPKPLSEEHQRIIDLLKEHHQHTDRPLVLCESEHYVTLRIPKIRRPSFGSVS